MGALLAMALALGVPEQKAPTEQPVEMMVLGVYHFANPGLDMINVEVDDVLAPRRQQELAALSDALATWQPTKILVEAQPASPDLTMRSYRENAAGMMAEQRSETYQIGYRLALQLGHENVFGFDEQPGEGEPNYFPIGAVQEYAAANGMEAELGALFTWAEEMVGGEAERNAQCSIAESLVFHNDPEMLLKGHSTLYYGVIPFGDADNQPGAELNAYWYMRNAKMFAKADLVAQLGDRILVIVGSGHKYWLDHFAETAPGYRSVDPRPYLEATEGKRCADRPTEP